MTVDSAGRTLNGVPKKSERELIEQVQERLVRKYAEIPAAEVSAAVGHAHTRFEHSVIRDFIPLLVERRVTGELSAPRPAPRPRQLSFSA